MQGCRNMVGPHMECNELKIKVTDDKHGESEPYYCCRIQHIHNTYKVYEFLFVSRASFELTCSAEVSCH